jgi:hypothetical protein
MFAPQSMPFVFIETRRMTGGKRMAYRRVGKHLEDIGADGKIILKLIFKK